MRRYVSTIIIIIAGIFASCELTEEDIKNAIDACEGMTLEELRTTNELSDECRAALNDLLPQDENNLAGSVTAAGSGKVGDSRLLFVLAVDASGAPIDLSTAEILVSADGVALPDAAYKVTLASDIDATVVSAACALDYSGSMLEGDIDDAIDIYDTLFAIPIGIEAEYSIFSETVLEKTPFTSDTAALEVAVARDQEFERSSTALFDAMGFGIEAVAGRQDALIRLLVVATDGGENSSTLFTVENSLYATANAADVHIVIMGSLLADLDFMRRAAENTNGFYFYSKAFGSLADKVDHLIAAITAMGAIEITDATYTDASSYEVTVDGTTINF